MLTTLLTLAAATATAGACATTGSAVVGHEIDRSDGGRDIRCR